MNLWGILLIFFAAGLGCLALLLRSKRVGVIVIPIVLFAIVLASSRPKAIQKADSIWEPRQVKENGIASSQSCRSCHPGEYASWHRTFHRTMTQRATPKSVLAPFDDISQESRGRKYRFERKNDEFWVTMANPEWEVRLRQDGIDLRTITDPPIVTRRILLTTGSHHLQTYWIADHSGMGLRQVPWMYHIAEKQWIPVEDSFLKPPDGTRVFGHWNSSCIKCHTVDGNPGYDQANHLVRTTVGELGIACEACHGPAQQHIQFHRNPRNRNRVQLKSENDPLIVNPVHLDSKRSSEVCGQCHSSFVPKDADLFSKKGFSYQAGGSLEDDRFLRFYDPQKREELENVLGLYWGDGTCRIGGREYLALVESPCFQRGELSCLSCHSMHQSDPNDLLSSDRNSNESCLQCHSSFRNTISDHTHHPAESSGSLCYNCHMPHTSYALFKAIRSHRVDSPKIVTNNLNKRPNACNLCHLDKTLLWSAEYMTEWYDSPIPDLAKDEKKIAASVLWMLRGNALQRAISAWHMGWKPARETSGSDWQAPFLAQLLDDSYSAVRFVAYRSLRSLPEFYDLKYDFIGSSAQRLQAKNRVLNVWRPSPEFLQGNHLRSVLIDSNGTLQNNDIDRLKNEQDNSPIRIQE